MKKKEVHKIHSKSHDENKEHSLAKLNLELQNKNIEMLNAVHLLVKRIDHLISIFEEAAKNVANVDDDNRIKELTSKLDVLLDQNKNLSNSILLLEKYVRTKTLESPFKKI